MKVTFYSGVGSVTGANFLLETGSSRVLIDCGLIQGEKEAMKENERSFDYDPSSIDILFITHAHLDHVGRIPKLVKEGFKGEIYSTAETKALASLILEDAVGLIEPPLYEIQDVKKSLELWNTIPYHNETKFKDFSLYIKDAGHILGSGMLEFTIEGKKIVFTGDLGNSPTPLLRDTESIEEADYVIMESVYGDRNHEPKELRRKKLEKIIKDVVSKGGTLVIPAFSLERTQVIIYEINKLVESKVIPSIPVFIDSPLATRVTEVYQTSTGLFNERAQGEIRNGDDIFNFPKLSYTVSREDSQGIDRAKGPKIIIAGSGMSVGGRVRHHEERYLPDPKNTILLVGYQTLGTVGRHIMEGAKKVNIGGVEVEVKAKIESILGYSSHKDSDHLIEFVGTSKAKKIFVVMGEPKSATFLAQRINNELGLKAICPERGVSYEI